MEVAEAVLRQIKGGWLAMGDGWAAFGKSQEAALAAFAEAERRHAEIDARPLHSERSAEGGPSQATKET